MTTKTSTAAHWPTVGNAALGSAALVAGPAAIGLYLLRMKQIQERAQKKKSLLAGEPLDKYAMENPLSGKPSPADNVPTYLATGAGIGLAGYGAWKLVHHLYQKHRDAAAKAELNEAEQEYTSGLQRQRDHSKMASDGNTFGFGTKAWGLLAAGLVATALGGGIAANKLLSRKYPTYSPSDDWEAEDMVDAPHRRPKLASEAKAANGRPTRAEALEHLIRLGLQDKRAQVRDCGFQDLVCAAASGRTKELKQAVHAGGVDLLFDTCKGARHIKSSALNQNLAITWLARDPLISEAVIPIAVAEFNTMAPTFFKLAQHVPEEEQEGLYQLFADAGRVARREALDDLCKKAGAEVEELVTFPEQAGADFFEKLLN